MVALSVRRPGKYLRTDPKTGILDEASHDLVAAAWKTLPDELRLDMIEAAKETISLNDGEGLGAPYDEDAYGTASYIAGRALLYSEGVR